MRACWEICLIIILGAVVHCTVYHISRTKVRS
uniref:Uncharacterized protein n=1 Tax=Aedes aegypti TaxID=7159 RepID=A0A6E8P832_AEDAE